MTMLYSFNRNEKLKSRKQLDELFVKGKSLLVFPIKIVYLLSDTIENSVVKVGVGVSKKNFKLAVSRNRIKRLLRETYRINKLPLINLGIKNKKNISIFFLYIGKEIGDYKELNDRMQKAITKLIQQIE